ncbi:hypothetical protein AB0B66_21135 [Catellatospora sp. NPDC049111]|uniref:hypothetical protein n=1 Tax=Catellatospora sp. NPDC049111 TaxID=3155271 RepID=UPI00340C2C22
MTVGSTGAPLVAFEGEDHRSRRFDFTDCPLPGWHEDLAAALAARVGPAGGLRTSSSAIAAWNHLRSFLRFLDARVDKPAVPADLGKHHVEAFRAEEVARLGPAYGGRVVDHVWRVLRLALVAERIAADVLAAFRFRVGAARTPAKSGYTDGELRRIVDAARADVAGLRERVRSGESLLARLVMDASGLSPAELDRARRLAAMAEHGVQPLRSCRRVGFASRQEAAERLFVTRRDVPAMLVLLVAVAGRNIETVKELPAEYRLLNDTAVELQVLKRRRGVGNWSQTVTWEIGPPGRELHHPGGLYLLLHELMARSRALAGDPSSYWAFWRDRRRTSTSTEQDHGKPFRAALTAGIEVKGWAQERGLVDDDGQPLRLEFNRLRTSIEVRRTRKMGGHLPSAARSNTVAVLFSNYLRDDPTVRDWAAEVTGAALAEAEQAALAAHRRRVESNGAATVGPQADVASGVGGDGPWSACRDVSCHPATNKPCRASFLDCFHCGNAMITPDRLPRLLSLLDALARRRQHVSESEWWARYGPSWAAIRHDILPRFTPAEVELARQSPQPDALLDLVEPSWEHP